MKTCLIYTVKNDRSHLSQLTQSLKCVSRNLFPFVEDLDVIMFLDPGLDDIISKMITPYRKEKEFILRPFITKAPDYPEEIKKKITQPIGYKNMCRFWAGEVFKDTIVQNYEYYMRLDCDSLITHPINYDPFKRIEQEQMIYGYMRGGIWIDKPQYCQKLNTTIKEFEKNYEGHLVGTIDNVQEGTLYYTNFEVVKIDEFAKTDYMELYNYLDNNGGIYLYRWGDHIIRYAGVELFHGQNKAKCFTDIRYKHQRFVDGVIIK